MECYFCLLLAISLLPRSCSNFGHRSFANQNETNEKPPGIHGEWATRCRPAPAATQFRLVPFRFVPLASLGRSLASPDKLIELTTTNDNDKQQKRNTSIHFTSIYLDESRESKLESGPERRLHGAQKWKLSSELNKSQPQTSHFDIADHDDEPLDNGNNGNCNWANCNCALHWLHMHLCFGAGPEGGPVVGEQPTKTANRL